MYETIPPGTIATLSRDGGLDLRLARWIAATREHYPGCVRHSIPSGNQIARQRNIAVESMHGEWLLFVDSDMRQRPDTLDRLLAVDRPIVSAVALERTGAGAVCAIRTFEPTVRWALDDLPPDGALPVLAAGTGCLLIRRPVLEALAPLWFTCGQLVVDCITEDTDFCLRAAEAGFRTYLACDVRVGHRVSALLWPREDGTPGVQWDGDNWLEPLLDPIREASVAA